MNFGNLRRIFTQLRAHPDPYEVPIIINNFNRLQHLQQLVAWLERRGYKNITVLDNASTYPPLLEWYAQFPHRLVRLRKNYGYLSLWTSGVFQKFRDQFYVYTDPDIVPDERCPRDFMDEWLRILFAYPSADKIGFGLRIDDLPERYAKKNEVIAHESEFWKHPVRRGLYAAPVDTTFALYRPGCRGGHWVPALRTGAPHTAKHLPWYEDSARPGEEEKFYAANVLMPSQWHGKTDTAAKISIDLKEEKTPETSVLMPVRNGAESLKQKITEVLSGLAVDDELIIVDDASTDGSWRIIDGFQDPRIRALRLGSPVERDEALREARSLARALTQKVS